MKRLNDEISLTAYSSDASIYSIRPKAVIKIFNSKDIMRAIKDAKEKNLSIIPRGGGTGLAGGALGSGFILDFAGFNKILAVDPLKRTVMTQVGIIYDELNRILRDFGLFFPPDPSSGDSCQIGGMLANNSSGPRSIKYGLTSDFVQELSIINSAGKLVYLKPLQIESRELLEFFKENPDFEEVYKMLIKNSELIKERWPKVKKNSAGYNLLQIIKDLSSGIFNLPALIVGSEGTLGVIVSAKLGLRPIPEKRLTARLYFKSLVDAGRAVEPLLKIGLSGLEIVDGATMDLIGRTKFNIPEIAAAMLLIEFDESIELKKDKFMDLADGLILAGPVDFAFDPESAAKLWQARKAIVPTLYRHHPTKRPISLVEDVSLPPDEIPSFIEYITTLFDKHNLIFGIFGHIGDGNLHIRPLFDLNDKTDLELAEKIYNEVYEKVISIGGSTTAEHADGRLRAPVLKKLYGDEIYDIFVSIKKCLDPDNIFSPGSVLSDYPFTKDIDYKKLVSFCAACGKCNGYCPAYDLFGREDLSPRGWLRIIDQSNESRKKLDKYLSFCMNCKNCTMVCPAGVDISSEILNYRAQKPTLLSKVIVMLSDIGPFFDALLKIGKLFEPFLNSSFGRRFITFLGKRPFGFDRTVRFPKLAAQALQKRYKNRQGNRGEVALFHGCADNLLESNVGEAVFRIFDNLGIDIKIPKQKCCGLPHEVYGHRGNLLAKAKYNIDQLNNFSAIITGCASCLLRLKEYEKLFEGDRDYHNKSKQLAEKCFDISQYLNSLDLDLGKFKPSNKISLTYHNPCHLRAAGYQNEALKLIGRLDNVEIIHPEYADYCCAQSGTYGFTNYQESRAMFRKKKEEYYKLGAEYIMTSCPACKMKIQAEMGGNFKVVHPVELLTMKLES